MLNRVRSANPSQIYGTLWSNGQVWLVNQAGIQIGPGGMVDTAGFVASTLNVNAADFLAGRLNFLATPGAGDVVNQGTITTPSGGFVYLVGSNVSNEGIIHTPQGETLLAAGKTVNLVDTATPGVKVEITGAEGNATNLGTITAEAGRIGIAGVLVKNSGTLNASSVVSEGGRVFLKATGDTYVEGSGRIEATGTKGGRVEVLGDRVAVTDNALIDASGANGGGTILVGGDYQGKNADIQNARFTYFGPNATLKADATDNGNGGKVILWADDTTRAYGTISARGGDNGGNGGFVETSGHNYLDVAGVRVDTRGPNGVGSWLLDPTDISITAGAAGGAPFTGSLFDNGGGMSSTLTDGDINSPLVTTTVTLRTTSSGGGKGDILVKNGVAIDNNLGIARTLSLEADRNITFGDTAGGFKLNF
ncbi:MAG: filamentous hemagglutinin N-terminal domain-containing protein, partial [Rhodocyclaceae bacterium]|nr:filamentous hemagglutinin N-terminal domain-containing protein [Rhodocyclaceae bacterium]